MKNYNLFKHINVSSLLVQINKTKNLVYNNNNNHNNHNNHNNNIRNVHSKDILDNTMYRYIVTSS